MFVQFQSSHHGIFCITEITPQLQQKQSLPTFTVSPASQKARFTKGRKCFLDLTTRTSTLKQLKGSYIPVPDSLCEIIPIWLSATPAFWGGSQMVSPNSECEDFQYFCWCGHEESWWRQFSCKETESALSISLQSPPSREQGTNTPKATDQFPGDLTLVYAEAKGAKGRTAQKMSLPYHKAILFHARNGGYNPKPMFHCKTVQTRTWLSGCVPPPQFLGAFLKCLHADVARNQEFSKNYLCILNFSFFSPFPCHPPPLQQHILLLFVST